VKVNLPLAQQIYDGVKTLQDRFSINVPPGVEIFTLFREVFMYEEPTIEQSAALDGVRICLEELKAMRLAEGRLLAVDMKERIGQLKHLIALINDQAHEHTLAVKEKYAAKIQELLNEDGVDEKRIMEEVAFLVEKSDIQEEIVRTQGHLAHMIQATNSEGQQGRRMDFLCQEINREVNTMGSKVLSLDLATIVVEMKCELERLRKQVQNIQ